MNEDQINPVSDETEEEEKVEEEREWRQTGIKYDTTERH